MPSADTTGDNLQFFGLPPEAFDELARGWGWPRFRAEQVRDWAYRKLVTDPAGMTNLAKADRVKLAEHLRFLSAETVRRQHSSDGTIKLLLAWQDNANAETVMIPDGPRRTACVSSQVGCPVGCPFCASGLNGVKGSLTAAQIVEQIVALNRILSKKGTERRPDDETKGVSSTSSLGLSVSPSLETITNIVFMGMGEPLANYTKVMQ